MAIATNEVCTNQGFKSVVPNENTNPLFLYYLLKYNKDKIEGMGSGTTFKEVSGNTMKNIVVSVPTDKKVQERISSMLGSIDDKIVKKEMDRRFIAKKEFNLNRFIIYKKKNMNELIAKIKELNEAFMSDAALQIEKGNKAAGTRARKASLELEKLMKEFRKASLEASK